MKTLLLLLAISLTTVSFARVWRVNSTPGINAPFKTAQQAHDSAAVVAGDTLYFESSGIEYGNLVMTKRLTLISTGWFLSQNPGLQYHVQPAILRFVTVEPSAGGSVFHCNMNTINIKRGADGCRIERCYFNYGTNGSVDIASSNNVVIQNYVDGKISLSWNTGNNLISNNIVLYRIDTYDLTTSATVTNNVINSTSTVGTTLHNLIFQNNIINKTANYTFVNCTVRNNLAANTTLPAGNGNVNSVNMANVFVNNNGADDVSFVLKGGSPAIGAGLGGINCGAFGGASPFLLGLQPAIPAIYQLTVPATASGASMNVTFSTKSNN